MNTSTTNSLAELVRQRAERMWPKTEKAWKRAIRQSASASFGMKLKRLELTDDNGRYTFTAKSNGKTVSGSATGTTLVGWHGNVTALAFVQIDGK
jgi:hypothetical protein